MRDPFPSGYLSYGAMPSPARERQCRYCGCTVVSAQPRPISSGEDCQTKRRERIKAQSARYRRQRRAS